MGSPTDAVLADLLDGARARGAFLLRSVLDPPWSLRIEDRAPLTLLTMTSGDAWVIPDGAAPAPLVPGEVALLRGPEPYVVADRPDRAPQVVIGPDQRCTVIHGAGDRGLIDPASRTWGTAGDSVLLSGTYLVRSEVGRRLFRALPPLLVCPTEPADRALIALLAEETGKDQPGQELVLDRILDLLLARTVRAWLAAPGPAGPAWFQAEQDPQIGHALRLLHERPADPWTVQRLAAETGSSRASFAKRFTRLVGEPPINYLTGWRLALAADLLRDRDTTVDAVARRVGYGSGFALSAAFKRAHGVSPQEYRRTAAARG